MILTLCKFHFFRICSPPLRITKDVERNQRSLDVIMEKLWQKLNKKWHKEIKDKKWKFRWFFHVFFVETKFRRILLQYGKKSVLLIFLHDIKKLWLLDFPKLISLIWAFHWPISKLISQIYQIKMLRFGKLVSYEIS